MKEYPVYALEMRTLGTHTIEPFWYVTDDYTTIQPYIKNNQEIEPDYYYWVVIKVIINNDFDNVDWIATFDRYGNQLDYQPSTDTSPAYKEWARNYSQVNQ